MIIAGFKNKIVTMLTPVTLSGRSATRLWPLSRENQPKQLLALTGHYPMLQENTRHLSGFDADATTCTSRIIVSNNEHLFMAAEQLRAAEIDGARIVLEPIDRNTAPARSLAAHISAHVVTAHDAFNSAVEADLQRAPAGLSKARSKRSSRRYPQNALERHARHQLRPCRQRSLRILPLNLNRHPIVETLASHLKCQIPGRHANRQRLVRCGRSAHLCNSPISTQ